MIGKKEYMTRYKKVMEASHIPYHSDCYNWAVVYTYLDNRKNRHESDMGMSTQGIVNILRGEVYG